MYPDLVKHPRTLQKFHAPTRKLEFLPELADEQHIEQVGHHPFGFVRPVAATDQ